LEDERILDLYWARSESAIRETAKKHGKHCMGIAVNLLHNREDAAECVSDTYLRAWEAIPPQRPSELGAFLGKITRNLAISRYRERRAQKRGGDTVPLLLDELAQCVPAHSDTEADFDAAAVTAALEAFLLTQSVQNRELFLRRYWYADSVSAIAEQFSMKENTVKSLLFRTRNKLRLHLEKEGVSL